MGQSQNLINERKYEQAIQILEAMPAAEKSGSSTLLLSTAYAGSAGLNLIDSFDFFSTFLLEKNTTTPRPPKKIKAQISTDNLQVLAQLIRYYLMTIANDSRVLFTIPKLHKELRPKLVEAILQAESIPATDPIYVRARQYLVFLNLILFGNYLKDLFPDTDFSQPVTDMDLICGLQARDFVQNLELALASFLAALKNLEEVQQIKTIKIRQQISDLKEVTLTIQEHFIQQDGIFRDAATLIAALQQGYCP